MYLQTQDRLHVYDVSAPISIIKKGNLFLLSIKKSNSGGEEVIVGAFERFEDCEKAMLDIAENLSSYSKNIFKVPDKKWW